MSLGVTKGAGAIENVYESLLVASINDDGFLLHVWLLPPSPLHSFIVLVTMWSGCAVTKGGIPTCLVLELSVNTTMPFFDFGEKCFRKTSKTPVNLASHGFQDTTRLEEGCMWSDYNT